MSACTGRAGSGRQATGHACIPTPLPRRGLTGVKPRADRLPYSGPA